MEASRVVALARSTTSAPVSFEIRFAYCSGESIATVRLPGRVAPARRQPPLGGRHGRAAAGLEAPLAVEPELGVARLGLAWSACRAAAGRRARASATASASRWSPPICSRHLARLGLQLAQDLLRHGLRLGQPGVGLAALRGDDQLEQDHRHRDHRDHHDDHEEEPETAPEARGAELKGAHRGCTKARSLRTTSWQLQSLVHGAGRKPALPPSSGL